MTAVARAPGLIVAAPASGAGKTTVALGLMRAFARRGHVVQPYKCGPDYIDPAFHTAAAGRVSHNLDTWAMRRSVLADIVCHHGDTAHVVVAEGVMGLFDGVADAGQTARASTADLAALTGWPVVLVLDVSAQAETAAALALGCARYRPDVPIAGVILNRVAGAAHAHMITPALDAIGLPCFGALPRRDDLTLPERHLGLVQAVETSGLDEHLDRIADVVAEAIDLHRILAAARPHRLPTSASPTPGLPPPGQRIALASDTAFAFSYPHLLAGWRRAGAEVIPFSPLADEAPLASADAVWLPGGYPELHAGRIANASRFHTGLRALASANVLIHGECGGYMVLGEGLQDASGARHAMAGLLGVETSFAKPRMSLGYRRARTLAPSALGPSGTEVMGHEFHFASTTAVTDEPLVAAHDASGNNVPERGARRGSVTGTFLHVIDGVG
ncbi:cobyrinate a,c-diamide synthase [uncultured Hyphomicrobium sp.]|uniref:cobyrinate a,c-diamide synthase n=1 Tax=uncultured Hyphomicrobium sp. TaxID=194373 RepID=UPI0025F07B33|nr:cobyrinate a,c-diamide synthase [uncultured Hyphomicrobium sp.]